MDNRYESVSYPPIDASILHTSYIHTHDHHTHRVSGVTKRREKLEKRQHMKRMREAEIKLTELLLKDYEHDAEMRSQACMHASRLTLKRIFWNNRSN